jgi:hypothetical protein
MRVEDRRVLERLLTLGRIGAHDWRRNEVVLLDEWTDLTKRSTLTPIVERLLEEDEERRTP